MYSSKYTVVVSSSTVVGAGAGADATAGVATDVGVAAGFGVATGVVTGVGVAAVGVATGVAGVGVAGAFSSTHPPAKTVAEINSTNPIASMFFLFILLPPIIFSFSLDTLCCYLENHQRVERCDLSVVAYVRVLIPSTAHCKLKRDRSVRGGDITIVVQVAVHC